MAQWVKALAAKNDNLNLILKTHMVEESTLENCPLACTLGLLCVQAPLPHKIN